MKADVIFDKRRNKKVAMVVAAMPAQAQRLLRLAARQFERLRKQLRRGNRRAR
jgi:hypothetical protein